jgi:uncharacterized protein YggE
MQAAANAKERAEAYASGVAAEVGQLMKLSDPELASAGGRPIRHSGVVFEAMVASGGDDMPIETGEHEIVAAIDATFALRPI